MSSQRPLAAKYLFFKQRTVLERKNTLTTIILLPSKAWGNLPFAFLRGHVEFLGLMLTCFPAWEECSGQFVCSWHLCEHWASSFSAIAPNQKDRCDSEPYKWEAVAQQPLGFFKGPQGHWAAGRQRRGPAGCSSLNLAAGRLQLF